ncbi:MAG: hypothetical protein WDW38_008668 [Sanguina aurantia]
MWNSILMFTQGSGLRTALVGLTAVATLFVAGNAWSGSVVPELDAKQRKESVSSMSYDSQRTVRAQQQRLSSMIKEVTQGGAEQNKHWDAVMAGTLLPHPMPESKTQALDNLRASAKEVPPPVPVKKGWW